MPMGPVSTVLGEGSGSNTRRPARWAPFSETNQCRAGRTTSVPAGDGDPLALDNPSVEPAREPVRPSGPRQCRDGALRISPHFPRTQVRGPLVSASRPVAPLGPDPLSRPPLFPTISHSAHRTETARTLELTDAHRGCRPRAADRTTNRMDVWSLLNGARPS